MAYTHSKILDVRIYVHKEHLDFLNQAIGSYAFTVKHKEVKPEQTLASVHLETIGDTLPSIIDSLVQNGVPYDIYRKDGGTGYARFNEEGKYLVSATMARKQPLSRDWDNQVEYRKRWSTLKLLNLIEDKPCQEKATTPSPWKTRNPILRGKSGFSQTILTGYGKP